MEETLEFYAIDNLDSKVVSFGMDGSKINSFSYDNWGFSGSPEASFTGKQLDSTGLYYFNARYYDPQTGRFLTEDPEKQGTSWYTYCNNNPINNTDPDGKLNTSTYLQWLKSLETPVETQIERLAPIVFENAPQKIMGVLGMLASPVPLGNPAEDEYIAYKQKMDEDSSGSITLYHGSYYDFTKIMIGGLDLNATVMKPFSTTTSLAVALGALNPSRYDLIPPASSGLRVADPGVISWTMPKWLFDQLRVTPDPSSPMGVALYYQPNRVGNVICGVNVTGDEIILGDIGMNVLNTSLVVIKNGFRVNQNTGDPNTVSGEGAKASPGRSLVDRGI